MFSPQAYAKKFQVVVLPVNSSAAYSKLFNTSDIDEIVAIDVINNFNSSYKIEAPNLSKVKSQISLSNELKDSVDTVTSKFTKNSEPDYSALKVIADSFNAKSVLIVYSYVQENGKSLKRDFFEIMKLSCAFELQADYNLVTEAVLFDDVNNLVMWSAMYKTPLNKKGIPLKISNELNAQEQVYNVKLYSKDILSKNISENVTLRFYPKSVNPITVKPTGEKMDSGVLKFDKDIPSLKKLINKKKGIPEYVEAPVQYDDDRWGEWIFDM